ncbi:hypothetical protein pb186bvf_011294 [Paramecium bursaria]
MGQNSSNSVKEISCNAQIFSSLPTRLNSDQDHTLPFEIFSQSFLWQVQQFLMACLILVSLLFNR